MSSTINNTASSRHFLHGIFRCFHPHNESSVSGRPLTENKPSQDAAVPDDAIPVMIYGESSSKPRYVSKHDDPGCCSICLCELITSGHEPLTILPKCSHMFHKECIDRWLPSRSLHCPLCRDRAAEELRQPESNNYGSRNQSDTDDSSALLVLNFVNTPTRYSTFM